MNTAKVIDKLNEILKHEWTGVAQYAQQAFLVTGPWRQVFAGLFNEGAEESFKHARTIGDKIVALGGVPTIERNKIQQSRELDEMLEQALAFERAAVELYKQAIALCEDDRALVVLLEDILLEEQQGVDDLEKLVRQTKAAAQSKKQARHAV